MDLLIELKKPIGGKFFSLEIYLEKIFNRKISLSDKECIERANKGEYFKTSKIRLVGKQEPDIFNVFARHSNCNELNCRIKRKAS